MADFNLAIPKVLDLEGGFQNHPDDSGNYYNGELIGTNRGITPGVYAAYLGRDVTESDMLAITQAIAKDIYKVRYWDRIKGDLINSQAVAEIFFDGAVNHGVSRGTKLMQETLNQNFGDNLSVDGVVGPLTLAAINQANASQLHNAYKARRIDFYHQIVANKPSQSVFLQGWLNRMNEFPDLPYSENPTSGNYTTDIINGAVDSAAGAIGDALAEVNIISQGGANRRVIKYILLTLPLLAIIILLIVKLR